MPGPSNSTNRFGGSSYVVGTPANGIGNGVNFTSIQAAYNQAVADGYGPLNPTTIHIRPGSYTEDLAITDGGIYFQGSDDGSNAGFVLPVVLNGSITCTITGPNFFAFSNMGINNSAGATPAFAVTGAAVAGRTSLRNCVITGPAGNYAITINNPSGTFSFLGLNECIINGDLAAIYNNSRTIINLVSSLATGNTDGVVLDSTGRITSVNSTITAASGRGIFYTTGSNQCNVSYSTINAGLAAVDMTAGGSGNIFETVLNANDASGFSILGVGNLTYCDIVNGGTAIGLDPGLTVITVRDWKPYAETGAPPAPSLGTVRGTSCYDNTHFTVTDGFVQLLGGPSGIVWTDQAISTSVLAYSGSFVIATITLTLPAAPVQGDLVMFKVDGAFILTIQASGAQVIKVGNTVSSAGGTAMSSADGDALELTYRAGSDTWIANSQIGNWILA